MKRNGLAIDIEKRLDPIRLEVRLEAGKEILVLFGPSGAGKTSTLNAVAGLLAPEAGEIRLGVEVLFRRHRAGKPVNVPARRRGIGYVFQSYALFPHLSARDNVGYALARTRGGRLRTAELLEQMGLAHLAGRYPHELSGGQQQRVAIARALAAEPRLLLLDEPFAALDAAVREQLQGDLRRLQAARGLTVLYVTHRLEDAFAVGHRLAVMREGRVEQCGSIEEVFRQPSNREVASILGLRNLFQARVLEAGAAALVLDWDGLRLEALPQPAAGGTVTAYIRPEDVKVLYPDRPLMDAMRRNQVEARVLERRLQANLQTLLVGLPNGHTLEVGFPLRLYSSLSLAPGDAVRLAVRKEGVVVLRPPAGAGPRPPSDRPPAGSGEPRP
jgi:molybdate transport system ATP-binding protein